MTYIRSRPHRGASLLGSTAAALALVVADPAYADEVVAGTASAGADAYAADVEYGEAIVVTSRHREENSQDVPIAISVVSAETLERTGNFTVNQIQQQVPTLQISSYNPRNTNINIRGLGANSSFAVDGLEYGVGFYVDGVYYGRPGQSQFDLIDLQQIEVLRGPQGTLFGKNTTAGALNITTREPSFDPELTGEGSLGDYDYHQVRATGSLPIIADKVAVRLSIGDTHRGGFLTNVYDGSDAQNYDNFTIRGQLLIKPTEDLEIRVIGDYSKQKQHFALTLVDGYFSTYANGATITNNIFDRAARLAYALPAPDAFLRVGNADSRFQANMESYGVSGQVTWDVGNATLTSITAYRWWDWYPANDADGTSLPIMTKAQQANFQRQFSQELRIASNGRNTVDYQAGLFYYWQKLPGYGATAYGSDFADWNLNPATTPAAFFSTVDQALSNLQTNSFSNQVTKSYAAFGQVDWHILDALTLTAGLRFTHEDKKGEYERFLAPDSGGDRSLLTPALQSQFQVSDLAFSGALESDALTGLLTLAYKVTPDVLLYGSYSRGNKSGGLNITAGGASRPVVDPEKVNAFEIGVKSQFFGGKLTVNADAFLTEITDYQSNVSEQIPGTTQFNQYIANIPKVRSKGLEADISFSPSKWLSFSGSTAYTDARFVDYTNAPQAPERANEGAVQDLSDVRLPGVSKFAYSASVDASQPLSDSLTVYGRADWLHRSSYNASGTNSIYSDIPGYGILNARVGLRMAAGQVDLSVWARNLLDKEYYVNRSAGTFGLITALPGDPRTFGVTLRGQF
jgi:iron complex outermembrane receptor protein